MNRTVAKEDLDSRIFNTLNIILLCICTIIIVVPLWNVVISSLSSGKALAEGGFIFWSPEFSLENYRAVFQDETIGLAFVVSLAKTFIGVITHVFFCAMIGYGLSKKYIRGRKLYVAMGVITMFFSGGMIPTYLLIKSLGALKQLLGLYYPSIVQLL